MRNFFENFNIANTVKTLRFAIFLALCCQTFSTNGQSVAIETASDVLLVAMPAAALGSTLILGDHQGTWQFSKGFVLNQVVTAGLKYGINKKRPFDNGVRSFPSGHTSTTFQSAAFLQKRYGWEYGIPAYCLAAFTGYSRINAQRHDGWDVVAGALIGIGSTYIFTTPYQREHFDLTFASWDNNYALAFTYKF